MADKFLWQSYYEELRVETLIFERRILFEDSLSFSPHQKRFELRPVDLFKRVYFQRLRSAISSSVVLAVVSCWIHFGGSALFCGRT